MIVICTKAPIKTTGFKVGDVCHYDGTIFRVISRSFNEETNTPEIISGSGWMSLAFYTGSGFEFKPTDAGNGDARIIWFKQYHVKRHPDWEGFPDHWNIVWRWRWSKKWHGLTLRPPHNSTFKSRGDANEALSLITLLKP